MGNETDLGCHIDPSFFTEITKSSLLNLGNHRAINYYGR
ncbi:hypothetical protein BN903_23 [Halorubrum sp. AJ67]|nr:hypothetical protein BN903_23 [Halorubrum sp. AJ67]